jgi:hypothetical protein
MGSYLMETSKFIVGLTKRGFENHGSFNRFLLTPSLYKDADGNRILTGNIHVCTFNNSTVAGNLGCVTFALSCKIKYKGSRKVQEGMELNKTADSKYQTANEALDAFDVWHDKLKRTLGSYKKIM